MLTRQLAILQRLTLHLEGTEGYDLRGHVFRGRNFFSESDPSDDPPLLSIKESPRPEIGQWAGPSTHVLIDWALLVQAWAQDDPKHPTDPVYALKGALEQRLGMLIALDPKTGRALYPTVYMLGNEFGIDSIKVGPGTVQPASPQVSSRAFAYVPLVIKAAFDVLNPFVPQAANS